VRVSADCLVTMNNRAMSTYYSRGEVLWLLSLSHDDAIEYDAVPHDSCASLAGDRAGNSADDNGLPVIVRWNDVRRARQQVRERKGFEQVMRLRAAGFTEVEVARICGVGRLNVHRSLRIGLQELVMELGVREQPDALPVTPTCLQNGCGEPRVYLRPIKRRVKGGWRTTKPGRYAAVCVEHLDDELRARIAA
jgi:hypothetical protein